MPEAAAHHKHLGMNDAKWWAMPTLRVPRNIDVGWALPTEMPVRAEC